MGEKEDDEERDFKVDYWVLLDEIVKFNLNGVLGNL